MNFDDAIRAHSEWKIRLSLYIKHPDGSLSADDVCKDNKCQLGQWIYGDGAKYKELQEYEVLRLEHAKFHRAAAEVLKLATSGRDVSAQVVLGGKSDFSMSSRAVVNSIMAMKKKVASNAA